MTQRKYRLCVLMAAAMLCGCGGGSGAAKDDDADVGAVGGSAGGSAGTPGSGGSPGVVDAGAGGRMASGGATEAGSGGASGDAGTPTPDAPSLPLTNPSPGAYGMRANMLEANSEMAVAALEGRVYVLGGYPSSRVTQSTLQIYDIAENSWRKGKPCPVAVHHPVLVGVGGKLYSLGGQMDGPVLDTNRVFAYDPATDDWQEKQAMPTARGGGAGAAIGNKIYVVAGRPPAGNAFEVYDVGGNTWASLPRLPTSLAHRNHLAAVAIGGKVYVAGGRYDGGGFASPITDSLDIFDPANNRWSKGKPMLRPRGGVSGVVAHGCFHVMGGEATLTGEPNDVFPDHDVYDPRTDTWKALPRLPVPFHGVTGGAFSSGLIYMPGGGTRSGGTSGSIMHQVFRPDMRCDGA